MNVHESLKDVVHPINLSPTQKLQALADRFYSGVVWNPKIGDYYTTSRSDMEVYVVVNMDEEHIYTSYLPLGNPIAKWKKSEFTTEGFGPKRVWVAPWVFEHYK